MAFMEPDTYPARECNDIPVVYLDNNCNIIVI